MGAFTGTGTLTVFIYNKMYNNKLAIKGKWGKLSYVTH